MPKYYEMVKMVKLDIPDNAEYQVIALVSFASTKKYPKGTRVVKYFKADIFGEIKRALNTRDYIDRKLVNKVAEYNGWDQKEMDWNE